MSHFSDISSVNLPALDNDEDDLDSSSEEEAVEEAKLRSSYPLHEVGRDLCTDFRLVLLSNRVDASAQKRQVRFVQWPCFVLKSISHTENH